MKTLVTDIHYFAPSIFFASLDQYSNCIFEQYENYQKMSFRNRCSIVGANGIINLSIPLSLGRDQKTLMRDVRLVNDEAWQAGHWKSITSCYNRAPWFEHYCEGLSKLYKTRMNFLLDWNLSCFQWLHSIYNLKTPFSLTEEYLEYGKDTYTDLRNHLLPATINQLYPEPPRYSQVFEERLGFVPNLSILDRLFCMGNRELKQEL